MLKWQWALITLHHSNSKNNRAQTSHHTQVCTDNSLGSKSHSTWKCEFNQTRSKRRHPMSPRRMLKEKRRGPNSSQQQAVNPSHSFSSSSPSSATPKNQKKKNGSKGSSPPRLDPFSPGTNTSNLKVFDPISGLQCAWNDFRKLSKDELKTTVPPKSKDPLHQVLTAV